eukprot:470813-Rhodomonas_salina.1
MTNTFWSFTKRQSLSSAKQKNAKQKSSTASASRCSTAVIMMADTWTPQINLTVMTLKDTEADTILRLMNWPTS